MHDAMLALTRGSFGDTTADVTVASVVAAVLLLASARVLLRSTRHSGQH
jgi:hypothetical protein